jgi:hypothetical protein
MARPKLQVVKYFPHTCASGKTLFILEEEYGNDGYAFWFKLLELLGTTPGHCVDYTDISVKRFIAAKSRVSVAKTELMLQLLAELEAIDKNLWLEGRIWSQNFVNNIYLEGGLRRSEIPQKPSLNNNNTDIDELLQQKPTELNIIADLTGETKLNEIKLKETKLNGIHAPIGAISGGVKKKSNF